MSKYDPLWRFIAGNGRAEATLSFTEIRSILGFPIDHSFLQYKKELSAYGYQVLKISLKEETVRFQKTNP